MHDLSLYLLELIENSVAAGARRVDVGITIDQKSDEVRLWVDDDGPGLAAGPERTLDPFYTTKPGKKTGLGLSLLKADAEAAGGGLVVERSVHLGGARVETFMALSHIDRPPLGDLAASLTVAAATNRGIQFTVTLAGDQFVPPLEHAPPLEAAARLGRARPPGSSTKEPTDKGVVNMAKDSEKPEDVCSGCCEEASPEELLARLDEVIDSYEDKPGALIPVLQLAQGICGYLPEFALKHIAKRMKKPYSEVAGVVGFYSFFSTVPRGRNLIRVCLGTACYVRGGMQVLDALRKRLDIDVGETTADREFSLEVARCFGACGLAPVITINDVVHHRVKPARVGDILAQYSSQAEVGEPVAAGASEGSD